MRWIDPRALNEQILTAERVWVAAILSQPARPCTGCNDNFAFELEANVPPSASLTMCLNPSVRLSTSRAATSSVT